MTINEKIHFIRIKKGISQAELAYKTGCSINEIISFEKKGTIISGYVLLQLINAFDITLYEFQIL